MNKSLINKLYYCLMILPFAMLACTEADYGDVNTTKITKSDLNASFKIDSLAPNKYRLVGENKNVISSQWDLDNGGGFGKSNSDIFVPDAGTYKIRHVVIGAGGIVSDTVTKTLVVAKSDPLAGNLIKGGKFITAGDIAQWTIGGTGSTDGVWLFGNGKATLKASGWAGRGMYQAIQVVKDRKYQINMTASSNSGCVDTWFEVYCGYAVPTNSDYSEGGKLYSINTWDGNGNTPFSGKISVIGTKASDNTGVFTATKDGTAYLVIRGGGSNMQDGISITNIEFRAISQ